MPSTRQTFSGAIRLFFGKVSYPGAYEGKIGIPMDPLKTYRVAPATIVANGVAASQSVAAGADAVLNGSLVTGGVAVLDIPRCITLAWTTASTITIRGTDAYGRPLTQTVTTAAGVTTTKAFKTITRITSSASITVLIVGTSKVIGLPVKVGASGLYAARFDNAIDAGTLVPADDTTPSATTGDVRGTFTPAGTMDGAKYLSLLMEVLDPSTVEGTYGKTQFTS